MHLLCDAGVLPNHLAESVSTRNKFFVAQEFKSCRTPSAQAQALQAFQIALWALDTQHQLDRSLQGCLARPDSSIAFLATNYNFEMSAFV